MTILSHKPKKEAPGRPIIGAVIIKNRKLLLVRKEDFWILPGGKPKSNENDLQCLLREVYEELQVKILRPIFFTTVEGTSPRKGYAIIVYVYTAEIDGEPTANSEISELCWAGYKTKRNLSEATQRVLEILHNKGYL